MGQDFSLILLCGSKAERYGLNAPGSATSLTVNGYVLHWITYGKGTYHIDGKRYDARAGDIFLLTSGMFMRWDSDPLSPTLHMGLTMWVQKYPASWPDPKKWPIRRHMPENDIIRPLIEFIVGNAPEQPLEVTDPPLEAACQTLLATFIFGTYDRPHLSPQNLPSPVGRVIQFMNESILTRPRDAVTLDKLAEVGGVSRAHLCRLCRQHLGYPPIEVMYMFRLSRSLIGLRAGLTVETLANDMGFSDAAHYVHRFTAFFGKSPNEMRKAMSKGYVPKLPKVPGMGG